MLTTERRTTIALTAEAEAVTAVAVANAPAAADAHRQRRELLRALAHREKALGHAAPVPRTGTEACAALAAMALRLRTEAKARGVALGADESFGFAAFAQSGPGLDRIPEVHRQALVVETVVGLLLECEPVAVLGVQREGMRTQTGSDAFNQAPVSSLRVEGAVGSTVVQVQFSGRTGALRAFLNRLALAELPLVVRGIECEAGDVALRAGNHPAGFLGLEARPARFTVWIECARVEPAVAAELAAGATGEGFYVAEALAGAPWPEVDQANVDAGRCELFTSPVVAYDPAAGTFRVARWVEADCATTAGDEQGGMEASAPAGPFRIQLLGFIGLGDTGVGAFADLASGGTFLAGAGQTVPGSGIAIRAIQRIRRAGSTGVGGALSEWVTAAEIEDLTNGDVMTLTDEIPNEPEVLP